MRSALTSHAALLTYFLICVKHKTLKNLGFSSNLTQLLRSPFARYLTTILSFLASAVMHIFTCPGLELHMTVPELWLHLGTTFAVVAEDAFMSVFKLIRSRDRQDRHRSQVRLPSSPSKALAITTARMANDHSMAHHRKKPSKSEKVDKKTTTNKPNASVRAAPNLIYRGFGYVWVTCFFTWAMSNLMFALYNH